MKRLAILGWTNETDELLRVWWAGNRWQIAAAAGLAARDIPRDWRERIPRIDDCQDWLDGVDADAVVVSAAAPGEFDDVLRRLAGQGLPMLLLHPACDSLMAHEVQMLYPAAPAPLLVWYRQRRPQFGMTLQTATDECAIGKIGSLERITWTSFLTAPDESAAKRELVRAAHWCTAPLGHYRSMQGRAPGGESIDWSRLSARLTSHNDVMMDWQIKPAAVEFAQGNADVTFEGTLGRIEFHYDARANLWTSTSDDAESKRTAPESFEDAALWTEQRLHELASQGGDGDDWIAVCQSLEIADQVEYTVRRRRVVDLVQETPSEEAAFKGVMAAGSCALLLVVLAVFALGSLYESVIRDRPRPGSQSVQQNSGAQPDGNRGARWWRFWPVLPLLIYLIAQGLIFVARQEPRSRGDEPHDGHRAARE